MSKYLRHNLTSDYLEAARMMSPRKKRRRIVAYVESYDDIAFWRSILKQYENETRYFEVMLPGTKTLQHGKKTVLFSCFENRQFGQNLIACVDSDYDFLLQGATETSRRMMDSDYVFQTYCYAIENYQCFAGTLHDVCVAATLNDHHIFNFEEFMTRYSEIVYPLFMWNLFFYRRGDLKTFPMKRLHANTALQSVDIKAPRQTLDKLEYHIKLEVAYWEQRFPKYVRLVEALKKKMRRLGLTPQTSYLYMQGHHIMDNVVMKVLTPVCNALRREQEDLIKRKSVHTQQLNNELTGYENSSLPVETVLRKLHDFSGVFMYQWILDDLNHVYGEGDSQQRQSDSTAKPQ